MKEYRFGGIWPTPGVTLEPEISLTRWRVIEVHTPAAEIERHLIGYSLHGREGRVSTAIVRFDPQAGTAVTRSGRIYRLVGPPGADLDADYVWRHWSRLKQYSEERDVTEEYVCMPPKPEGLGDE